LAFFVKIPISMLPSGHVSVNPRMDFPASMQADMVGKPSLATMPSSPIDKVPVSFFKLPSE